MLKRLDGLRHECDLLAAEIELHESGERKAYDFANDGGRIDITELWIAYLRSQLALKRSLKAKLRERYKLPSEQPQSDRAPKSGETEPA